jgi:hypothetical protein
MLTLEAKLTAPLPWEYRIAATHAGYASIQTMQV